MISVLLPVHNAAATLPDALDSLLRQSFTDLEIIAVDDGSDDRPEDGPRGTPGGPEPPDAPETSATRAVLQEYARNDRRVRVLGIKHGGIVQALNHGLTAAGGEYIARMDADDVSHPERLQKQVDFLRQNPDVGLVACRAAFGGSAEHAGGYKRHLDWTNTLLTQERISLGRFRESPLVHPTVLFRKELVHRFGVYRDGPFPEDYELWLRWLSLGVRMAKLPETFYVWNDPPHRLSRTHPRYGVREFYAVKAAYLAKWLAKHNPHHPRIMVMGAGRITRRRAEMLLDHGVEITAWLDIDPCKINRRVAGRPVIHRDEAPSPGRAFLVSYVAGHGGAEDIEHFLRGRGYLPGRDYLLAA
ncbi:glycosyltransferase [Desulfonatronum lacustre]|uniref:glycosyltransferase n=1 Tax=Desulfonatronum lacustre TaxID=66849 RepID=UPI000491A801|nr:glycosyltransferase [Desulfonatronum lacustre]